MNDNNLSTGLFWFGVAVMLIAMPWLTIFLAGFLIVAAQAR